MAAKEKKGLGTGLAALFGDDDFEEVGSELLSLPISKVEPRKEQPREYFDEAALQELAESIAQFGLIQPIVVRKLDSGYYQIIAGERRWRASRMAGLTEVPVRVIEADDVKTAQLALVENLQREDLNPIEEAKGYKALIEIYGLTQEEAAKSVGKSRPAITNSMRLLSLDHEVLELVEKGKLSAGHARALIPIENARKQLEVAREVIDKALSVRKTEALVGRILREKEENTSKTKSGIKVDYAQELSNQLSALLGRKVRLLEGRKGGKIELEYYDSDDREVLIGLLKNIK